MKKTTTKDILLVMLCRNRDSHTLLMGIQTSASLLEKNLGLHNKKYIRTYLLKPSSSAGFMINLSIQNFIPLHVLSLFPSRLRSIKQKGVLKPHTSPCILVL